MGRFFKLLLRVAIAAAIGLAIYAMLADLPPPTREIVVDLPPPVAGE